MAFFEVMTERTPRGRLLRRDGLVLAIGSDPSPVVVNTIIPEATEVSLAAVTGALEPYRSIGHSPSLMSRDHHDGALAEGLRSSGWRRLLGLPGMVLDARPELEEPPAGVTIHPVASEAGRQRWIEGNLHGFAEDDSDRAALRSAFATIGSLTGDPVTAAWAEADGRGVGSSMATLDPETGMAIVGWVGTDEAYRRRGIGRAITLAAIRAAFDLGAIDVGLQASPMGLPVYERLGFRTVTGYQVWLPPAA